MSAARRREYHGMRHSPEYQAWRNMRRRCNKPGSHDYEWYGGRGITVSQEWNVSFEAFFAEMGCRPSPKHQIDRIDNSKGYEAGNCRWVLRCENMNNRRNTVHVEHDGKSLPLAVWAKAVGVNSQALYHRIVTNGWDVGRALSEPMKGVAR